MALLRGSRARGWTLLRKAVETGASQHEGIQLAKSKPTRSTAVAAPGQPPRLQVAALCWRRTRKGLRILLITSRDTGRWVIPKGWPMRNRTEADAAAREAWEEAGLRGEIATSGIGVYTYRKRMRHGDWLLCVVRVYPLEAREMLQKFPETGQRRARWFSREKAARKVEEHELAALIRAFDPDGTAAPRPGPAAEPTPDAPGPEPDLPESAPDEPGREPGDA